jgi:hypothetical protein
VFIVQGKPREPEGIVKVTKATRKEALEEVRAEPVIGGAHWRDPLARAPQ